MINVRSKLMVAGRRGLVIGAHLLLWTAAYMGAFLLRFDGTIPDEQRATALRGLWALLIIRSVSFWFSGLFHGLFRYAGIPEVKSIVRVSGLATVIFLGMGIAVRGLWQPRSIYVGELALSILAASGLRLAVRVFRESPGIRKETKLALLIGAGDAGEMFLRDLARDANAPLSVVGILDDDPSKHGSWVRGIRVSGSADETSIRRLSQDTNATLAVLAIPGASGSRTREIVSACRALGIETKTLPSLQQILTGDVRVSMLRDVAIEDLLRREPIQLDEESMATLLRGKRVLVTGGAGSIGSELARQAGRYQPGAIALLDHNENGMFFLERELRTVYPNLSLKTYLGDVKDPRRISDVLGTFRPHVVLHAAAHKHVPLMEANPGEAIKNNVFGTRVVADLANAHGVETFVLISTDKAVNPTSVMGASKRIAEMYLQSVAEGARTTFVAVRFGNVLASAGSVIPIFREQIATGGPVTVTHPEMRRYFMTIPEASQLVLQAGALATGGEIFVLDMGDPIKIVDLAHDMIRMSGFVPEVDVKIVFSGPRPGEKLSEELFREIEDYDRTRHPKILAGRIEPCSRERMATAMDALSKVVEGPAESIKRAICSIVPEAKLEGATRTAQDVEEVLERLASLETLQVPTATQRTS